MYFAWVTIVIGEYSRADEISCMLSQMIAYDSLAAHMRRGNGLLQLVTTESNQAIRPCVEAK